MYSAPLCFSLDSPPIRFVIPLVPPLPPAKIHSLGTVRACARESSRGEELTFYFRGVALLGCMCSGNELAVTIGEGTDWIPGNFERIS